MNFNVPTFDRKAFLPTFDKKSNGIFVPGLGFFLQTNFAFLTSTLSNCFYHSKGIVVLSLSLRNFFTFHHF